MDRGTMPSPEEAAATAARLIAAGSRAAAARPGGGLAQAALAVQAALAPLWPSVTPEAARDAMTACAAAAVARGTVRVPGDLSTVAAMTADDMLDMTARWQAGGSPAPPPGRLAPPASYASDTAFEPAEDSEALEAVCLLIALAYPAGAGTAGPAGESGPGAPRPSAAPCHDPGIPATG